MMTVDVTLWQNEKISSIKCMLRVFVVFQQRGSRILSGRSVLQLMYCIMYLRYQELNFSFMPCIVMLLNLAQHLNHNMY